MKTLLPDHTAKIGKPLAELKQLLTEHYRNKLEYVVLYGSYARGDFNADSDIDILVVLNEMESEMKELETLAEIKTDLLLTYDFYISTNPVSAEKLKHSEFQFYKNIRNEGIIL